MYLDVFSCKPFNPGDVEFMVGLHFYPKMMNRVFLTRQAPRYYLENGSKLNELK